MKKCPNCGFELADNARFCHKCGSECRSMEVKRRPEPEAETAGEGLIGDKNLINESTIIGKQEKYEASNITIHNTINEDQSHKIVECAVSGKRIYLDQSVVCPQCGGQVALEYYVEASKRCENCERKAREEYRGFVARVMEAPGPFDAARKQQLDAEAQRLCIDASVQASILRDLQQRVPSGNPAELSSVQRAELEAAANRLITASQPEEKLKSLETFAALREVSSNGEVGFWYFLARAIMEPDESVKSYEEELTDDYWQRYWGFLAYCNTGSPKGSAAVDRVRSVFGDREDDVRLAETAYFLARGFDSFELSMLERAGKLSASIRRDRLSEPLTMIYDALQRIVRGGGIHLDTEYTVREIFVFMNVFRARNYIAYLHVEKERQKCEQQAAEEARRQKQAELTADRSKRMEQEMARLSGARPAAGHSPAKAFAGYETVVPAKKKSGTGKIILIVAVCLLLLIGLLFLIPAPESLQ